MKFVCTLNNFLTNLHHTRYFDLDKHNLKIVASNGRSGKFPNHEHKQIMMILQRFRDIFEWITPWFFYFGCLTYVFIINSLLSNIYIYKYWLLIHISFWFPTNLVAGRKKAAGSGQLVPWVRDTRKGQQDVSIFTYLCLYVLYCIIYWHLFPLLNPRVVGRKVFKNCHRKYQFSADLHSAFFTVFRDWRGRFWICIHLHLFCAYPIFFYIFPILLFHLIFSIFFISKINFF